MKKIKSLFFVVLCFFMAQKVALANDPVNVYIFKSSTCSHCSEALTFFDELSKDSEYSAYFHLIPYETYGSTNEIKENIKLAEKVSKHFGGEFEGVPLIIIGDKQFEGYSSNLDDQIKKRIKTCYEDSCEDIVAGIQNGTLKSSNFDVAMPIVILVVLIGGITYLIVIARQPVIDPSTKEESSLNEFADEEQTENSVSSKKKISTETKNQMKSQSTNKKKTQAKSKNSTTKKNSSNN